MAHLELPQTAVVAYEDIQITTNVARLTVPLDPNTTQPCTNALIQAQKANVRVRVDGGDPTSTSGILLLAGDTIALSSTALQGARLISDTRTAVTLSVTYFA